MTIPIQYIHTYVCIYYVNIYIYIYLMYDFLILTGTDCFEFAIFAIDICPLVASELLSSKISSELC